MTKIKIGKLAPDATLTVLDGRSTSLSNYWGNDRHLLIIFLRHLA